MNNIDFQNGFLCGMATKGMIKTGEPYRPLVWNDPGVYDYFYVDFKKAMMPFSLGILRDSTITFDSQELSITKFEKVSTGVFKLFVDISTMVKGVTFVNKASSFLEFKDGSRVPPFSTFFYVAGLDSYMNLAFAFDEVEFDIFESTSISEQVNAQIYWNGNFEISTLGESANILNSIGTAIDYEPIISYWAV